MNQRKKDSCSMFPKGGKLREKINRLNLIRILVNELIFNIAYQND